MNYGTVGVFGALALGAALGAILPVPAHEGHEPVHARPELSLPRSAEYDDDPPAPGSYELPVLKPAADANIYTLGFLDPRLVMTDVRTLLLEEERVATLSRWQAARVAPWRPSRASGAAAEQPGMPALRLRHWCPVGEGLC